CSTTCGTGVRTRTIECRDAVGSISKDCEPAERPHTEQECKTNIPCPIFGEEMRQPLMQPYPPPSVSEKLIDQPIPFESTFIVEQWSPCSVTCGEGIKKRKVQCRIYLEFSKTFANLPDHNCSGPKPVEKEKCVLRACNIIENSLIYGIDTVGDRSDVQTTYSWKETGYTPCSATCLGGIQELIVNCIRDDNKKTVTPFLCTGETKPEARIKVCNDHPCPPRWNFSEFLPCNNPCGIGIQTRDVTCIHEVTRGTSNTVPNYMCPQPLPADRQYCNVLDCPVKWSTGDWSKCSKTCGVGVRVREVTCEQVMAQGHTQSREEHECPSPKPASKKPCNTRECHTIDAGSLPIITSQNTTYNQTDLNANVDLKIGGIAEVFHGISSIKIRCPVRKFDKALITWAKDNRKLKKSRKYKISRKGALKIKDIISTDAGVYACIAGNSQAETQIIVKSRTKEQISSEEYLRLSNSVHRQRNANLDSAPANSGESLYTDRAAAYGNRFVPIDSEDLSHERAVPSKPTRKPHQKKQKTSPTPPDSTMMHKENTITSLNQPGYHESVESTAPSSSSASTLVPHLTYFISTLKEYWPFQSESSVKRSHRTAPVAFIDDVRKEAVVTKRTMPERNSDLRYQNVEDNLDILYRNTAIPDETFGPDEERIFIDVDPYDLDESMFGLDHSEPVKITPVVNKDSLVTPAKSDINYVEESLKNVKRQWHDTSEVKNHWSPTSKNQNEKSVNLATSSDNINLEMYYMPNSNIKETTEKFEDSHDESTDKIAHDNTGNEHVSPTMSLKEMDVVSKKSNISDEKIKILNQTEDYGEIFEEEMKKRKVYVENDTVDDSIIQAATSRDLEDDLIDLALTENQESEEIEKDVKNLLRNQENRNNSFEDTTDFEERSTSEETQKMNKFLDVATTSFVGPNATIESTIASLSILDTEDLIFEWVTTDWSKCSQTCGGSGFQMRRAQCTVRAAKPIRNTTRTAPQTVVEATLCEDAGHPVPQKVRPCGFGKCPQWHTTEWTPCETSRCFTWKTAMQRRNITCRLVENIESRQQNITLLDPNKCDDTTRPLQRQECYNDACKGVWRVGNWSECTASCEEDGIKYRILQCVWYGTKKPAGNACRDIPRPPVMKTCRGPLCPDNCKDHSQLCSRVKTMNRCRVPLYQKQCCQSCQQLSAIVGTKRNVLDKN
ncbi:ADAMTS-like protein 1, partial [Eufriesea mexicana]